MEIDLYAYIGGICRSHASVLLAMGGTADHVHLLVNLGKTVAISDLMLNVKRDSSRLMKQRVGRGFSWQQGYFGFTIGESGVVALRAYIKNQKVRHRRLSFQDEVRELCRKYGENLDERYAWE